MADHEPLEHYEDCITCFEALRLALIRLLGEDIDGEDVPRIVHALTRGTW